MSVDGPDTLPSDWGVARIATIIPLLGGRALLFDNSRCCCGLAGMMRYVLRGRLAKGRQANFKVCTLDGGLGFGTNVLYFGQNRRDNIDGQPRQPNGHTAALNLPPQYAKERDDGDQAQILRCYLYPH